MGDWAYSQEPCVLPEDFSGELSDFCSIESGGSVDGDSDCGEGIRWNREIIEGQFRKLCKNDDFKRRFLYSGIFRHTNYERAKEVYDEIATKGNGVSFAVVFWDTDHSHVLHDCPYSNRSCRCFGVKFTTRSGRVLRIGDIGTEEIDAIFEYFFQASKQVVLCKMRFNGESKLTCQGPSNEPRRRTSIGDVGQLQDVEVPDDRHLSDLEQSEQGTKRDWAGVSKPGFFRCEANERAKRNFKAGRQRTRAGPFEETCEDLEKLLLSICTSPITEGTNSDLYLESTKKWTTPMSSYIKNVILNIKLRFKYYRIKDYIKFYKETEFLAGHPLWQSHDSKSFEKIYLPEDKSTEMLKVLLAYQLCGLPVSNDGEYTLTDQVENQLATQLEYLAAFFNRELGKKNTIYIVGGANCGKSLFADMLQDYFLNPGIMSNWNKWHNFPLQMCQHVSFVQWNEPNFAPDKENDLKKLLGGDRLSFDIKNQNHGVIVNTPVLITGNNYIFPNNDIWNSRIKRWDWQQAPFLAGIAGKRLHPFAFINLITWAEDKLERVFATEHINNII